MKDAFGVNKAYTTPMKLVPKYMKIQAARSSGAKARRILNGSQKTAPPTAPPKAWYKKGSNQALVGLGAAAVGGGAFVGYRRSQNVGKSLLNGKFIEASKLGRNGIKAVKEEMANVPIPYKNRHAMLSGVSQHDAGKEKTFKATIAALRPIIEGKRSAVPGLDQMSRDAHTEIRGRRVVHADLPSGGPLGGSTAPVPSRERGQRHAIHFVATSGSPGLGRQEALRHEIRHTNKRKPLSSAWRQAGDNRKAWQEEARADSAMQDPDVSGYNAMALGHGKGWTMIGDDPKHMRRYLKVKKKIVSAQGESKQPDIVMRDFKGFTVNSKGVAQQGMRTATTAGARRRIPRPRNDT